MRIVIKPAAYEDIKQTADYIETELNNPSAAFEIQKSIFKGIERLINQPKLGKKLRDSEYRYIIIRYYLVFYTIDDDKISIIRILDGRTDYIKYLF